MNIKNTENLGAAVRARRKQLKLTQKDVATACGTGVRFIIELERGKPTSQVGKTLEVLRALGLTIEARIAGDDAVAGKGP